MTVGDLGQSAVPGQASLLGSPDDGTFAWEPLTPDCRTWCVWWGRDSGDLLPRRQEIGSVVLGVACDLEVMVRSAAASLVSAAWLAEVG